MAFGAGLVSGGFLFSALTKNLHLVPFQILAECEGCNIKSVPIPTNSPQNLPKIFRPLRWSIFTYGPVSDNIPDILYSLLLYLRSKISN